MEEKLNRLRKQGIVLTLQRIAVLEFLEGKTTHPTVEEIYDNLKKKYPTVSPATVYNSLEVLKQAGEIQSLTIRKDKVCFDPDPRPHHHFFCKKCKGVIDVGINCPVLKRGHLDGHKIEEMQAYFYGICSNCMKKGGDKR